MYAYRCDGKILRLSLEQDGDPCGSLTGLHSNDIVYIQQAATHVEIKVDQITVSARIVDYNVSSTGSDVVYIQFDKEVFLQLRPTFRKERECDSIHFILKHSYFQNLHRSLHRVTPRIIDQLIPESGDLDTKQGKFQRVSMPVSDCLLLDKEYQLLALKKMMACDSGAPFLVTGPFGTGKTRLLAAAAVNFLKSDHNRVLICTSHLNSADAYIDSYFGPLLAKRSITCSVRRLTTKDYTKYRGHYHELFTDGCIKKEENELKRCRLVITTFLTAPHLIRMKVRPFTHILIDEGAQTREPETIAPLGLADDNAKIVIAGDHLQVYYCQSISFFIVNVSFITDWATDVSFRG